MKIKAPITLLSLLLSFNALAEHTAHFRLDAKIQGKAEYARGKSEGKTQFRKIDVKVTNISDKVADANGTDLSEFSGIFRGFKMVRNPVVGFYFV